MRIEHHLHRWPHGGAGRGLDLVQTFLAAGFSHAPRHLRRLSKVAFLEF